MEYIILSGLLFSILAAAAVALLSVFHNYEFILHMPRWRALSCHFVALLGTGIYGYFLYTHLLLVYSARIIVLPLACGALLVVLYVCSRAVSMFEAYRYEEEDDEEEEPEEEPALPEPDIFLPVQYLEISGVLFSTFLILLMSGLYLLCHFVPEIPAQLGPEQFKYMDYHIAQCILIASVMNAILNIRRLFWLFKFETPVRTEDGAAAKNELYRLKKRMG